MRYREGNIDGTHFKIVTDVKYNYNIKLSKQINNFDIERHVGNREKTHKHDFIYYSY